MMSPQRHFRTGQTAKCTRSAPSRIPGQHARSIQRWMPPPITRDVRDAFACAWPTWANHGTAYPFPRLRGVSMFTDILKLAIMSSLQERVVGLGVCPRCHSKSLRVTHEAEEMRFNQCRRCLTVWVDALTRRPSKEEG